MIRHHTIVGINHKKASLAIRERFSVALSQAKEVLRVCKRFSPDGEWMIVSTCNRTELWCYGVPFDKQLQLLSQYFGFMQEDLLPLCYHFQGENAYRHAASVASGLDSMVIGEPQILGQIKQWYQQCYDLGGVDKYLDDFCQQVLFAAKKLRHNSQIGQHSVSLVNVIVSLIEAMQPDWSLVNVIWVGAGEMIQDLMPVIEKKQPKSMMLANRSLTKAEGWVNQKTCQLIHLQDLSSHLRDADVVISGTASLMPIIGKGLIERSLKGRRMRPMTLIDLAVPRDIEPEVKEVDGVYLYDMDALQKTIECSANKRQQAVQDASIFLAEYVALWREQKLLQPYGPMLQKINQVFQMGLHEITQDLSLSDVQLRALHKHFNDTKQQVMLQVKHIIHDQEACREEDNESVSHS